MPKVDENAKSLVENAGLLRWANYLRRSNSEDYIVAASAKLVELITAKGEKERLSIVAAANNVPATKDTADIL